MDPLRWSFLRRPSRERHPRSPELEGRFGLELAVRSPGHDGDQLSLVVLVTYRLPIEVATAYADPASAIVLFVEEPESRRAAAIPFSPLEIGLDSTAPFRGIQPASRPIVVTGWVSGDLVLRVPGDHAPLFFRAELREHGSPVIEVRRDRTITHRRGIPDVVVEGDDR